MRRVLLWGVSLGCRREGRHTWAAPLMATMRERIPGSGQLRASFSRTRSSAVIRMREGAVILVARV